MSVAPVPGLFEKHPWGRPISKEEAYAVIEKGEEAGLVHMTSNVKNGHSFICNCCGCCCAVLKGITKLGLRDVVNSDYYSSIDSDQCSMCGLCAESVCQVNAITEGEGTFDVDRELCIGCGVCLPSCPYDFISLVLKQEHERVASPADGSAWRDERSEMRGVDYSSLK